MSIIDNDNSNQQPGAGQPQSGNGYNANPGANAPQQPTGQPVVNGLVNVNEFLRRSGSFDGTESRSAEALAAFRKASEQAVANQTLDKEHDIYRFDRDANRVGLPSILIVRAVRREGKVFAVVRTLILDTDAVRLKPKTVLLGAERIDVPVLPQHLFNDLYWSRISTFLRDQRGIAELQTADAGPLVIPKDFDFKDEAKVTRLLVASVNRCDDIIARLAGEQPFSIAAVKGPDEFFTSRLDLTNVPQYDLLGNPIRSDLVISMGRSSKTANQNAEDFYDADTSFNSLSCYVNLEYTPPVQQQANPWQPQQPQTQFLTPTIVITNVKQADWITANTPELYFLALSNAFRVTANTQWARAFLPAVGKKKDPRDIGAIAFLQQTADGKPGKKIQTKGESFTDADFVQLMTMWIKPFPSFLIDVNPVGENAAIENLFLDSANPSSPNQKLATEALVKALNNLTGNKFGEIFDHKVTPIVVPYNLDVSLGYYLDEHGERRDRRDLGTLEMLNATDGDLGAWTQWYRSMVDGNIPSEIRMKQRDGFDQLYLGNVTQTGVGTRLLLHPAFIQALDAATIKAGVSVNFDNISTVFGAARFTGNDLVSQYTVTGSAQVNYGTTNQSAGYGVGSGLSSGRVY